MTEGNDTAAWAKAHEACYETEPIMEVRDSVKIQAGFVLSLYARLPMEVPAGEDRRAAGGAIWERLHAIVTEAIADQGAENVTLDIEPLRTASRPPSVQQAAAGDRAACQHPTQGGVPGRERRRAPADVGVREEARRRGAQGGALVSDAATRALDRDGRRSSSRARVEACFRLRSLRKGECL